MPPSVPCDPSPSEGRHGSSWAPTITPPQQRISSPSSPRANSTDSTPESYLAEIFRVLPYWPRDRYLELAPKYWSQTRARLREDELALLLGHISVPPPPAEQTPAR